MDKLYKISHCLVTASKRLEVGQYVVFPEGASNRLINRRLGVHGIRWEPMPAAPHMLNGTDRRTGRSAVVLQQIGEVHQ